MGYLKGWASFQGATDLNGQCRSNQLILPFSVEDIRSTLQPLGNDRDHLTWNSENNDHLQQQFMDVSKDGHGITKNMCPKRKGSLFGRNG